MRQDPQKLRKRLEKKAKKGFRGYPIETLAAYGPNDRRASKLVASVVEREGAEPTHMRKWTCQDGDARRDPEIAAQVAEFFDEHTVMSVVMPDRIIGCPHEEGVDYQGDTCPQCPFWAIRDRWSGDVVH